jgi:hypothetical protein
MSGTGDVQRAEDETQMKLSEIIRAHDRSSLSKKFPEKLSVMRAKSSHGVV